MAGAYTPSVDKLRPETAGNAVAQKVDARAELRVREAELVDRHDSGINLTGARVDPIFIEGVLAGVALAGGQRVVVEAVGLQIDDASSE